MASAFDLIAQIYEAAACAELWPTVLDAVARHVDAFGACFLHRTEAGPSWVTSPPIERMAEDYFAGGWGLRDERVAPLLLEHYPGFRVETDYWREEQLEEMAIHREFLRPRGLVAGAGCLIQGAHHDAVQFVLEGMPSYAAARAALPRMEVLRPHLARALTLTAQLRQSHARGVVQGLAAAGIGAAVVGADGRLRAANEDFAAWFGGEIQDLSGRIRLSDKAANSQLTLALSAKALSRSFPVRGAGGAIAALHAVLLRGRSRDVFESDGFALLIARPGNRAIPTAELLRLLFDLTPAEARLARLIAQGRTIAEAALACGVQTNTARTQLKAIYAKTGFVRQSDLAVALASLGTGSGTED